MNALREMESIFGKLQEFCLLTESEEKRLPVLFFEIEKLDTNSEYFAFVKSFNNATGLNYKGDPISRMSFYEGVGLYNLDDRIRAVKNALKDHWIKDNPTFINLKNFCKNENIEKYANYEPDTISSGSNGTAITQEKDFTAFKP